MKTPHAGIALLTVLWVLSLLTLLAGSAVATVRIRSQALAHSLASLQARFDAESALNAKIVELAAPDARAEKIATATPVTIADAGTCERIEATDAGIRSTFPGRRIALAVEGQPDRSVVILTGDERHPVWILHWPISSRPTPECAARSSRS